MRSITCIIGYFYVEIKSVFKQGVTSWGMEGERLRSSGQSIFPVKILYEKYKSNHKRHYSSISRFRIVSSGVYEEWGSLAMEHLNDRKRKNFC